VFVSVLLSSTATTGGVKGMILYYLMCMEGISLTIWWLLSYDMSKQAFGPPRMLASNPLLDWIVLSICDQWQTRFRTMIIPTGTFSSIPSVYAAIHLFAALQSSCISAVSVYRYKWVASGKCMYHSTPCCSSAGDYHFARPNVAK
jgi:hypothetical protein